MLTSAQQQTDHLLIAKGPSPLKGAFQVVHTVFRPCTPATPSSAFDPFGHDGKFARFVN